MDLWPPNFAYWYVQQDMKKPGFETFLSHGPKTEKMVDCGRQNALYGPMDLLVYGGGY